MNLTLCIALFIFGSMLEAVGVLSLTQPNLKFIVPKPAAFALIGLGGLVTIAGTILLVMR